jgi:hypothetical protein
VSRGGRCVEVEEGKGEGGRCLRCAQLKGWLAGNDGGGAADVDGQPEQGILLSMLVQHGAGDFHGSDWQKCNVGGGA